MCFIVFRRREHVHRCYQEKETGALLLMISGEDDWCSTFLGRRAMGLYLSVFYRFYLYKT